MSGKFPLMIFGLPGAALAMYKTAKPEKKKAVAGLLLSAALTSMLTGITEPLEFTFIFVAPMLYGIHCVFAGLAYMLMHLFNVGVGMTFSGGHVLIRYLTGKCKNKLDLDCNRRDRLLYRILLTVRILNQEIRFKNTWP